MNLEQRSLSTPGTTSVVLAGTLIDGTGAAPRRNAALIIEDGKITRITDADAAPGPSEATVIDARDATVLPGLIDAHIHLTGWRSVDPGAFLTETPELRTIRATADLSTLLDYGFTAVRDMGSADGVHLRAAVEEGALVGPRIVSAHKMLCQTAGNGDTLLTVAPERLDELGWLATLADGVDECRKATRRLIRQGADFIKICTSGGGASAKGGGAEVQFTLAEVQAVVEEAHRTGRRVAAHAHANQAIRNALDAGVDTIEHGTDIDDASLEEMAERGIVLVPTLVNIKAFADNGELYGAPPRIVQRAKEDFEHKVGSFARAYAHGVSIAHGADTGGAPPARHGINAGNLKIYVDAGMKPMDALRSATAVAAGALDLADTIGTLQPGKLADLIVVDGDPLADIAVLADRDAITMVLKSGEVVRDRRPTIPVPPSQARSAHHH